MTRLLFNQHFIPKIELEEAAKQIGSGRLNFYFLNAKLLEAKWDVFRYLPENEIEAARKHSWKLQKNTPFMKYFVEKVKELNCNSWLTFSIAALKWMTLHDRTARKVRKEGTKREIYPRDEVWHWPVLTKIDTHKEARKSKLLMEVK